MKHIVHTPHEALTKPAAKISKFDTQIKAIISDMKETLVNADNPKGVGLAAPQVGLSLRIFLMRPEEEDPIRVFINPEFTAKSKTLVKGIPGSDKRLEGCLSIPKVWGMVTRHKWVKLKFMDEKGEFHEEKFEGFLSTIVQHEMDHLDGILFARRVIEQKGQLYKPVIDENGKEILEPLDI